MLSLFSKKKIKFGEITILRQKDKSWSATFEHRGATLSLTSPELPALKDTLLELKKVDLPLDECEKNLSLWSYLRLYQFWTVSGWEYPFPLEQDDYLLLYGILERGIPHSYMEKTYTQQGPEVLPPILTEKGKEFCDLLFEEQRSEMNHKERRELHNKCKNQIGEVVYKTLEPDSKVDKPFVALCWGHKVFGFYKTKTSAVEALEENPVGTTFVYKARPGYVLPPTIGHRVDSYWKELCAEEVWRNISEDD